MIERLRACDAEIRLLVDIWETQDVTFAAEPLDALGHLGILPIVRLQPVDEPVRFKIRTGRVNRVIVLRGVLLVRVAVELVQRELVAEFGNMLLYLRLLELPRLLLYYELRAGRLAGLDPLV